MHSSISHSTYNYNSHNNYYYYLFLLFLVHLKLNFYNFIYSIQFDFISTFFSLSILRLFFGVDITDFYIAKIRNLNKLNYSKCNAVIFVFEDISFRNILAKERTAIKEQQRTFQPFSYQNSISYWLDLFLVTTII